MSGIASIGSITDVDGIRVGHATRVGDGWLTGTTVVLPEPGTVGGVDVRGGGPGTHETDALDPRTLVPTVDAVVLTGGSAYGLAAAGGAQRWCEEQGRGFRVGAEAHELVPIVPAAAIFDLGRGGDFACRPGPELGYEAAAAAGAAAPFAAFERGGVGAGTGAVVGQRFKGGLGTASVRLTGENSDVVVGAIVVVNALGMPWPRPAGLDAADGPAPAAANTTIGVVATNAVLDAAETSRLATVSHDGLARALNPVHTLADGDTLFALATCRAPLAGDRREERVPSLIELHAAAAEATRLAALDGIRCAAPVVTPALDVPAYPYADAFDWRPAR